MGSWKISDRRGSWLFAPCSKNAGINKRHPRQAVMQPMCADCFGLTISAAPAPRHRIRKGKLNTLIGYFLVKLKFKGKGCLDYTSFEGIAIDFY